jgi:glycosyltransferase involved in cell wall biosynthesis
LIHRLKYTKTCDGIIAVSGAVRDMLIRSGIPSSHIEVIHTGIELPAHTGSRPAAGPITVGHMGAFTKEKGQDTLIAVARELPQVRFVLAGDGPLREELQHSATRNVEFRGFVSDAAAFFGQLDVFLMPSKSEAWGLAALEAMAHGVPVIGSDIQGLAEIIESGKSGWLLPSSDISAWTRAIAGLQRGELETLSSSARARAAQFTVAQMAEQTERFYARLLEL